MATLEGRRSTPQVTHTANDTVLVERLPNHVVARIDRPQSANALNVDVIEALHAVIDDVEATPRILVITGSRPGVFVGGSDIEDLARRRHEGLIGPVVRLLNRVALHPTFLHRGDRWPGHRRRRRARRRMRPAHRHRAGALRSA